MKKQIQTLRLLLLLLFYLFALLVHGQHLKSIMANACAGGGSEGENEYLILQNDSMPLVAYSSQIDIRYGNSFPASTTYSDTFLAAGNDSFVNALNTYLPASCDFTFINTKVGDTIPPFAYMMIVYAEPTDTVDFKAWCGSQVKDIYVLFSNDPSWSRSGNFVNAPSGYRYLRTTIHGQTENYSYTYGWSSNKDGNYVSWSDTGQASGYFNYSNCTPTDLVILPIQLISFSSEITNNGIVLKWSTASEKDNVGFTILKKYENTAWDEVGFVNGNGTDLNQNNYQFNIKPERSGSYYFQLKQHDHNNEFSLSPIVKVWIPFESKTLELWKESKDMLCLNYTEDECYTLYIRDLHGQPIYASHGCESGNICIPMSSIPHGVYLVVLQNKYGVRSRRIAHMD